MTETKTGRAPAVLVDCGSCRACCHQVVMLGDGETGYDSETIETPLGSLRLLRRQPDGACIYLTAAGCSIYENRPDCCRVFDCGDWYRHAPAATRKEMRRVGGAQDKRLLREGRYRAR